MRKHIQIGILQLVFLFAIGKAVAQEEPKIIKIIQAGGSTQDQFNFPGANILVKKEGIRVHLFHEGALIKSDVSYFYPKENFFRANGDVIFTQGDSLKMTCDQIEYDGTSKLAKAWGKVVLERPDMNLKTDTLFWIEPILRLFIILSEPSKMKKENSPASEGSTLWMKKNTDSSLG